MVLQPSQELRNAIDLIIVTTVGKWQKLVEELAEPRRAVRQVDVTGLNLRRLGRHSVNFAAFWFDADRARHCLRHGGSEVLQRVYAGSRILDHDSGRAMLRRQADDPAPQVRKFEATR